MVTKFTKEYFIEKFEAISDEQLIVGSLEKDGCFCALGACGVKKYGVLTNEAKALSDLFIPLYDTEPLLEFVFSDAAEVVYNINDAAFKFGDSPKERIINALKSLPNAD